MTTPDTGVPDHARGLGARPPEQQLTPTERQILAVLRERGTVGQCYLAHAPRSRAVLVAPEPTGTGKHSGRMFRARMLNMRTAWRLESRGLVNIGSHTDGPIPGYPERFRKHLESLDGRPITIMPAGVAALAEPR